MILTSRKANLELFLFILDLGQVFSPRTHFSRFCFTLNLKLNICSIITAYPKTKFVEFFIFPF